MLNETKRFGYAFRCGVMIGIRSEIKTCKLIGECTKIVGEIILKNVCEDVANDEKVIDRTEKLIMSY